MFKKLFNNEAGVSPIVATLVLVVVAIAGAAAVGTIMGSFSSEVSDSASSEAAGNSAATELLVAGSTTVQPVAELLAEAYMEDHPGVKVTVQGGGSDAGIGAIKADLVDIGMASKPVDAASYPDNTVFTIGYSAVVVIMNNASTSLDTTAFNITAEDMNDIYTAADDNGKVDVVVSAGNLTQGSGTEVTLYQRAEGSGTEETFAKWLTDSNTAFKTAKDVDDSKALGATGNQGVLDKVKATPASIGFVDYGFAKAETGVKILTVYDYPAVTESNIKKALQDEDGYYPNSQSSPYGLTRPLNFMTYKEPSGIEQSFINFALSPGANSIFEEVGYYGYTDIQQ